MDIVITRFLSAMQNLEEATTQMDKAFSETRSTQARHDAALKRLQDFIGRFEDRLDTKARDTLKSLSAKYTVQRRALDSEIEALGAAQQQYSMAKAAFDDLFHSQYGHLADRAAADFRRQKREAALARMTETTIRSLCAAQPSTKPPDFDHPDTSNGYIPLPIQQYLNLLISLDGMLAADADYALEGERYRPVSFLEIGCGQGRIMYLTRQVELLRCSGVEGFDFNPTLVLLGRKALNLGDAIFEGDAMAFDFSTHDVIYSYRPFRDTDMQSELETRLAHQIKPGAYLVAPAAHDLDRYPELIRTGNDLPIWKKAA